MREHNTQRYIFKRILFTRLYLFFFFNLLSLIVIQLLLNKSIEPISSLCCEFKLCGWCSLLFSPICNRIFYHVYLIHTRLIIENKVKQKDIDASF